MTADESALLAYFDERAFAFALTAAMKARGVSSYREVARQAGVSPSTITRVMQESHGPDVDTFAALCVWGQLDPRAFFQSDDAALDQAKLSAVFAAPETLTGVARLLAEDTHIQEADARALFEAFAALYSHFISHQEDNHS